MGGPIDDERPLRCMGAAYVAFEGLVPVGGRERVVGCV